MSPAASLVRFDPRADKAPIDTTRANRPRIRLIQAKTIDNAVILSGTLAFLPRGVPELFVQRFKEKPFQRVLRQIVQRNTAHAAQHVERLVGGNDKVLKSGGGGIGRIHEVGNGLSRTNFR